MDLQGLSFNRQAGDIKLTPEAALKLQAGDVVRGMVQTINSDGTVQLMVRGKSVLAESQVPLQAGQELYLQMDRMENGKLYLRVVDPQVHAELPDLALRGLLTKIGLKPDELTSTIARKLIAYNMPVTKENIEAVIKMTSLAAVNDGRALEAATYALSRNSRITNPENLINLVEFFSAPRGQDKTGQAIYQLTVLETPVPADKMPNTADIPTPVMAKTASESALTAADNDIPVKPALIANDIEIITTGRETGIDQKTAANSDAAKTASVPISLNSPDLPAGQETPDALRPGFFKNEQAPTAVSVTQKTITEHQSSAVIERTTINNNDTPETIITTNTASQKPTGNAEAVVKSSYIPSSAPATADPAVELADQPIINQPTAGGENKSGSAEARPISVSGLIVPSSEGEGTAVVNQGMTLNLKTSEPVPAANQIINNTSSDGSNIQKTVAANPNITTTIEPSPVPNQPVSSTQPAIESVPARTDTMGVTANTDIKSGITAAALDTLMQDADTSIDQVARRLSDLIKPALEAIITDLDQSKPNGSQLKQALKEQQALLPEIKFTRQILDQISNGTNHPVRMALESLDQEWSGQQLYNRLEGNAARDQSNIYFTLPLRWQGQIQNAEVSINWRRDNRFRTSLPDNLTVNLGLNTVNMGTVVFHLRTQNRQIGLSVYLDNSDAKNQIDSAIPELLTSLSQLGYQTSFMGSQVINQPNLHPEFVDTARENLPPVTGLDLKI